MIKNLAIAALALGLSTSVVYAQDSSGAGTDGAASGSTNATDAQMMPKTWSGAIGETFYSDTTAGTLREESDIKTRWSSLSSEQQTQVREDCKTFSASSGANDTAGTSTTGAASTAEGSQQMTQVCGYVGKM